MKKSTLFLVVLIAAVSFSKAQSDAKAVEILAQYIEALGGKEKLKTIQSVMMKMTAATAMGDINIATYMKDGKSAMKTEMAGSVLMEQKFDGKQIQVSGMGGNQILNDEKSVAGAKKQAKMFEQLDFLDSDKSTKKYIGIENINGVDAHKITIMDEDKNESTQYFDPNTKLLIRTISTSDLMGQKNTQTMDLSDYKEVNGVKFPHSTKLTGGSIPFPLEMKITAMMINSDLPEELFKIN